MALLRHPALWLAAFLAWFGTLWWLSSAPREFPAALDFRASDKLLHFGYFFGGSGLFSAWWFRRHPDQPAWRRILFAWILLTLVGVSDEWHQSTVPGRDATLSDLLADSLGALAGALVFHACRRTLS